MRNEHKISRFYCNKESIYYLSLNSLLKFYKIVRTCVQDPLYRNVQIVNRVNNYPVFILFIIMYTEESLIEAEMFITYIRSE